MRVLLINPPMVSADRPGYHHLSPPLGIMYLANFLRQVDVEVRILDLVTAHDVDLAEHVTAYRPDIVGISAMTGNFSYGVEIAVAIKSVLPVPVVFGGPHPTIMPAKVLEQNCIDYAVVGEGEITFLELIKAQQGGLEVGSIAGLGYKENGRIVVNGRRENIEDLNTLPFPAYDLIDNDAYITDGNKFLGFRHCVMIVTRGCPGKCTFCAQHSTMGRTFRAFSPKRVVDEIERLMTEYRTEGVWFKDSEFNMNRQWSLQFCEEVISRKLDFKWTCLTRADGIDLQLARKLKEAGLEKLWIGAESGSERILHEILNKEVSVGKVRNAFKACKSVGLQTAAFFMIGLPTETKEEIRMTFELMKELDSKPMQISIYHPLPGTELYDKYGGEEVTRNAKPEEMAFDKACMATGPLSKEEVQIAYDEIVNYFFGDGSDPVFLLSEEQECYSAMQGRY